jgi:hypothetical protein
MVIKGLKRITEWGEPNELIFTQYGVVKRMTFLSLELKRFSYAEVLPNENKTKIALFIKGEDDAGTESRNFLQD